jgi:predicted amidohydrolase YtcJ
MTGGRADLVLHNAQVLAGGQDRQAKTLIAVRDGLILWTGTEDDLQTFAGPSTKVIDCAGYAVGPGFIDAHLHLFAYAANLLAVDCSPRAVKSVHDVLDAIAQRAGTTPPGRWVRGWGIEAFHLNERRLPTRSELDAAAPRNPVKLLHRSGHACVVNSAALQALEISEQTPEPPGALMERNLATGELTGYLLEMEQFLADRPEVRASREETMRGLAAAERRLLAYGITSLHDPTPSGALSRWDLLSGLTDQGGFSLRVYSMFAPADLEEMASRGLAFLSGSDHLRAGSIKIMLNETGSEVLPPQEDLNAMVIDASRRGYQVAFHAVEEAGVAAAVTAAERASAVLDQEGLEGRVRQLRHRIEHAGLCPYPLRRRIAAQGLWVVTQPVFVREHGDRYLAEVPAEKAEGLYPIASLTRDGVQTAFGSDCPVAPPDPLAGLAAAVTRRSLTGAIVGRREAVSAIEALWMYTRAAAFTSFEEQRKGRIAPGQMADLVVLSRNPWTAPPEEIVGIRVLKTFVGGRMVWQEA